MEIYKITNKINLKIYIGKDTTSNPNYFGSGTIINKAIKKYGIENFHKEIIDTAINNEELCDKEKYWISYYNSTNKKIGYNISKGGDGGDTITNNPNKKMIREKISKSSRVKGKSYEEAYGIEKSIDYKNKLSLSYKKRKPRIKKEKKVKPDLRSKRWEEYRNNKKIKNEDILKNIKNQIQLLGFINVIDEIEKIRKKRINFGFNSLDDFYLFFGEEIRSYYMKINFINRSKANRKRFHTDESKQKIKTTKINKALKDLEDLKYIIDSNKIEELENYFTENQSRNIRKRFLKGIIKDFIPQKYLNIITKKIKLKPKWNEGSKVLFEKKFGKKIEIDGILYDSISGAAKKLGVDRNWVRYRLKYNKWPIKYNMK